MKDLMINGRLQGTIDGRENGVNVVCVNNAVESISFLLLTTKCIYLKSYYLFQFRKIKIVVFKIMFVVFCCCS